LHQSQFAGLAIITPSGRDRLSPWPHTLQLAMIA
jgi:hypothetical protein